MSRAGRATLRVVTTPAVPEEFPTYRLRAFLPAFLLGWGAGALLTFLVRALGQMWLRTPCEGHTLLALLLPLLLGPGGLGFTAANWRKPARAALGLGLVVSSLLPALYVGAQDIAALRRSGCAGGYIVFAPAGGESLNSLSIQAGGARELTGRIGGFTPQTHPGQFTLQAQSNTPGLSVTLPKTSVRAGEIFPIQIRVEPKTGINTYTVGVQATTTQAGKALSAGSTLEVNVRPAEGR